MFCIPGGHLGCLHLLQDPFECRVGHREHFLLQFLVRTPDDQLVGEVGRGVGEIAVGEEASEGNQEFVDSLSFCLTSMLKIEDSLEWGSMGAELLLHHCYVVGVGEGGAVLGLRIGLQDSLAFRTQVHEKDGVLLGIRQLRPGHPGGVHNLHVAVESGEPPVEVCHGVPRVFQVRRGSC